MLVQKALFLKALARQQSLIERKSPVPLLTHMFLESEQENLKLIGTDLELRLEEKVPLLSQEDPLLSRAVPIHLLYEIVRKLPDGPIHMATPQGKNLLLIQSGAIHFSIPALSGEDFPLSPVFQPTHAFEVDAHLFSGLLQKTKFCMASETIEQNSALRGVFLHPSEKTWRAVATDAHRLALNWIPYEDSPPPAVLLSRKTIQEIGALLLYAAPGEKVCLEFADHTLKMTQGSFVFFSRLLDGEFPDYEKVIPQNHAFCLFLEGNKVMQAVSRMVMVNGDKQKTIQWTIDSEKILLSSFSSQYGKAQETLPVQYEGPEINLAFNAKFLMEMGQHMKDSLWKIQFKDALSPVVFTTSESPTGLHILMPIPFKKPPD